MGILTPISEQSDFQVRTKTLQGATVQFNLNFIGSSCIGVTHVEKSIPKYDL